MIYKIAAMILFVIAGAYGSYHASMVWFGDARVTFILGVLYLGLTTSAVYDRRFAYAAPHFIVDMFGSLFVVYGVVLMVSGV